MNETDRIKKLNRVKNTSIKCYINKFLNKQSCTITKVHFYTKKNLKDKPVTYFYWCKLKCINKKASTKLPTTIDNGSLRNFELITDKVISEENDKYNGPLTTLSKAL